MRPVRQLKSGFWGTLWRPLSLSSLSSLSPVFSPVRFPARGPPVMSDPPAPDELRQSTLPFRVFVSSNTPTEEWPGRQRPMRQTSLHLYMKSGKPSQPVEPPEEGSEAMTALTSDTDSL